jgi:hypothetical protein
MPEYITYGRKQQWPTGKWIVLNFTPHLALQPLTNPGAPWTGTQHCRRHYHYIPLWLIVLTLIFHRSTLPSLSTRFRLDSHHLKVKYI